MEILEFMFLNSEEVLGKDMKYYQLSHQLGLQLSRKPCVVHGHWLGVIQPLLTRYFGPGDCLEVDYTSVLINYMARNDLQYGQDVRWSDLVTRSEFEGETTQTLIVIIITSIFTSRNHSQVASVILLSWVEERKKKKKLIEREEKIVEFYQFLQKINGNEISC